LVNVVKAKFFECWRESSINGMWDVDGLVFRIIKDLSLEKFRPLLKCELVWEKYMDPSLVRSDLLDEFCICPWLKWLFHNSCQFCDKNLRI